MDSGDAQILEPFAVGDFRPNRSRFGVVANDDEEKATSNRRGEAEYAEYPENPTQRAGKQRSETRTQRSSRIEPDIVAR
jgi:hypothetical protein